MLNAKYARGFTLIELIIGFVVVGILFMIGLPDFRVWLQNTQIRTAAESILNGMQIARTEAVRRNKPVRIEIDAARSDWQIKINTPPALNPATEPDPVQQRSSEEGSANALVNITPAGATMITFNGLGGVAANPDGSPPVTQVDVTSNLTAAAIRPLRVTAGTGGTLRLCDPDPALAASIPPDLRSC